MNTLIVSSIYTIYFELADHENSRDRTNNETIDRWRDECLCMYMLATWIIKMWIEE